MVKIPVVGQLHHDCQDNRGVFVEQLRQNNVKTENGGKRKTYFNVIIFPLGMRKNTYFMMIIFVKLEFFPHQRNNINTMIALMELFAHRNMS